jgi:hypothetical protein
MNDQYKCFMCQQTFDKGWSDEEAEAEKLELFGDVPKNECELACDDCFQEIKPVSYKEARTAIRNDMAQVYLKIKNKPMRRLLWKMNKEIEKKMVDMILYGYHE